MKMAASWRQHRKAYQWRNVSMAAKASYNKAAAAWRRSGGGEIIMKRKTMAMKAYHGQRRNSSAKQSA